MTVTHLIKGSEIQEDGDEKEKKSLEQLALRRKIYISRRRVVLKLHFQIAKLNAIVMSFFRYSLSFIFILTRWSRRLHTVTNT